ncbi:M35 family metallo-endopeptidase [Geobacter sp.]|uniref:M35 family metallo-endopeptidase n=1 Tax=Geobacter sp. TaxID=46610 RepID=UPI0027BA2E3E|nr:M35 family metallo-endopeptidase [Geobacter sp.]
MKSYAHASPAHWMRRATTDIPASAFDRHGESSVRQVLRPQTVLLQRQEGTEQSSQQTTAPAPARTGDGRCGTDSSCSASRCAELRTSLAEAKALVARAKSDLAPGERGDPLSEQTRRALMWHFRTDSPDAVHQIRETFTRIEERLNLGLDLFSCSDPGNICTFLWVIPAAEAYTAQGNYSINLCSPFFWGGTTSQATTIIHEAGHNVGLPRPPMERELYISGHEYRALSSAEALVTTDVYANFARDNRHGIPVRMAFSPSLGEFGLGLALTGGEPSLAISWGYSAEFSHPALSIIKPVAGIELTYIPALGKSHERFISSATVGARLAGQGRRYYLDLRGGAFIGTEDRFRRLKGIVLEAAAHIQPGRFDISLFWKNYRTEFEGSGDTTIIGIGGAVSF